MSFPSGVQTATLTFSNPITFLGNEATRTELTVQSSSGVVWAATGTPIDDFSEIVSPGDGLPGSLTVPFVDQSGFTDQAGNEFTMWTYIITRRTIFGGNTPKIVRKNWQPLLGQSTVDFDNLPGGSIGLPVQVPPVAVTSVAGLTLAVGAEDLAGALNPYLPDGVTSEDVTAAVAPKQDAATLDADVATEVTTPGSATATALSATILTQGNAIVSPVSQKLDARSPRIWELDRWAREAFTPPPAADLPTITTTTSASTFAWTIASPVTRQGARVGGTNAGALDLAGDPRFRYFGTPSASPAGADNRFVVTPMKPGGVAQAARWIMGIEFETNSPEVEILTRAGSTNQSLGRVLVNGRWVTETQMTATVASGGWLFTKLTFPAAGPRKITVMLHPSSWFYGASVAAGHDLVRPKADVKRRIAVIGDSFTGGSGTAPGGATALETYASRLAYLMGAEQSILGGIGGTKWVPTAGAVDDAAVAHFAGRIPEVLAMDPDVIVFFGSRNDDYSNPAAIQAAAEAALDLVASVPEVYVAGTATAGAFSPTNNAVKAAALAKGRQFIDVAGIIYGTGKDGTPTGDGNADYLMGTDAVHPTHEGHKAMARALFEGISGVYGMS